MAEEMEVGCARPTGGPVGEDVDPEIKTEQETVRKQATPSGWKPGKLTLKPGPDLVGKVWEVWKTEMAFD